MLTYNYVVASCFCTVFTMTSPSNFRVTINCPRHTVVVHWSNWLTKNALHRKNCFRVRNVSELWRIDDVAYCVHTRFGGGAVLIDFNEAALTEFDGSSLQTEQFSRWTTSN